MIPEIDEGVLPTSLGIYKDVLGRVRGGPFEAFPEVEYEHIGRVDPFIGVSRDSLASCKATDYDSRPRFANDHKV